MKSITTVRRTRARGFALIEVLIAVVVLATGLIALTALQGALTRASADSKARSQVAAYMTAELDRVRTGDALVDKVAVVGGTDAISRAAQAAGLASLSQSVTSQTFYANAAGNFAVTNPVSSVFFRRLTLRTTWTDAANAGRSLSMTTDLSPLLLASSKVLVDRPENTSALRPIVIRRNPETEGMIPLATGGADGEATAATNPKPKLLGGESGTYVADTRFDILTYSRPSSIPAEFAQFNKKIETAIVGCTCQNNTAFFTANGPDSLFRAFQGRTAFRPTFWNGDNYKTPLPALATSVTTGPAVGVSQSALCDVCCRDHKDPAAEPGPKFSPWPGQDVAHYKNDLTLALGGSDLYMESCRLIRVDGVLRVAADPMVQDVAFVPTDNHPASDIPGSLLTSPVSVSNRDAATSPRVSANGKGFFVNYAYKAVDAAFYSTTGIPAVGNTAPFSAIQAAERLNEPNYVPIKQAADRRWMHARAFVTDYMETDARDRLRRASADCTPSATAADRAKCVLPALPLASINTTEIANWAARSFVDSSDSKPSGLGSLASSYFNYATARLRRFNSGLALFGAINPAEALATATQALQPARDEQMFVRLSASAPATTPWLLTPSPNPSTARYFGNGLDPLRGYAETSPPLQFNLEWDFPGGNPASPMAGTSPSNDPTARVTGATDCTPNTAGNNTTNPHRCTSAQDTSVELTIAGFNRIEYSTINNPCAGGNATSNKPECVVYSVTSVTVNNPASSISGPGTLVGGTAGKLDAQRRFTLPAISTSTQSQVTINFSRSLPATTFTCVANQPQWTVPCQ
jgi:Tfp pilus assembly protein PilV